MAGEPLTPLCVLFEMREALGDLIFEGRVQGYDPTDGPTLNDPTGSLARTRVAIEQAESLLDNQRPAPIPRGAFAGDDHIVDTNG